MSLTSYRAAPPRGVCVVCVERGGDLIRSGGDLLSRVLGRSTISGGALNFRVRDGIGCFAPSMATRPDQNLWARGPCVGRARPATSGMFQAKALTLDVHDFPDLWGRGVIPVRHWIGSSLLDD